MNELDINNPQLPDFIVPGADEKKQDEPAKIKVIGVGGGGGNAVNHMYHQGIGGVSFVLCNTDAQALRNSPVPVKVQLGAKGEGAGNIPEVAKKLAEESAAEVEALFDDNTRMAFITAGMGGGTGTGAAPVVARIAKEKGVLTVGIVTIPFLFEGEPKILQAFAGVEEMRKHVDALLVINNERLCKIYPDLSWTTAFAKADDSLSNAARSIAELVSKDGKINLDFADVRTTLKDGGAAVISTGSGEAWLQSPPSDKSCQTGFSTPDVPLLLPRSSFPDKPVLSRTYPGSPYQANTLSNKHRCQSAPDKANNKNSKSPVDSPVQTESDKTHCQPLSS